MHQCAILSEHPHIVYPGNLQGGHAREAGPKGAMIVTVEDGRIASVEHRALDVVRWSSASFDTAPHEDQNAMLAALRDDLAKVGLTAEGRPVALRLTLHGATLLHSHLTLNRAALREDIETLLATLSGDYWLEKLDIATTPPPSVDTVDPSG